MDDRELNRLLGEWQAPDAPPHLRPRRPRTWRLAWLVTGAIRVPVPVALAVLIALPFWVASLQPRPLLAPGAPAQRPSGASALRPSGELARYALSGPLEGFDAVVVELNFQPGRSAPEHRHPGFVLGYVVDGQMRSAIDHQPGEVVPAGGTFFEPLGALHTTFGSASPDAPVRIVAFMVVPTGSPLTRPR